jgi:hypothetical protein
MGVGGLFSPLRTFRRLSPGALDFVSHGTEPCPPSLTLSIHASRLMSVGLPTRGGYARPANGHATPLPSRVMKWRRFTRSPRRRASSVAGTSRPSALAVFRFITSSYLVGACTGRSAGFSPLRKVAEPSGLTLRAAALFFPSLQKFAKQRLTLILRQVRRFKTGIFQKRRKIGRHASGSKRFIQFLAVGAPAAFDLGKLTDDAPLPPFK